MPVNFDTDLLRTFVAIVDAGGFTQAAKQVHRTQSAVSMQVRRLEEQVGKPLFLRTPRGLPALVDPLWDASNLLDDGTSGGKLPQEITTDDGLRCGGVRFKVHGNVRRGGLQRT